MFNIMMRCSLYYAERFAEPIFVRRGSPLYDFMELVLLCYLICPAELVLSVELVLHWPVSKAPRGRY